MTKTTQTQKFIARAGVALGAIALPMLAASPVMAQYYSGNTAAYEKCERRDNTTQVIGGLLGGVAGGLLGNELERGDRTFGTVVGAGAGAAVGARLGDRNCEKYNTAAYRTPQPYRTTTQYPSSTTTYYPSATTYSHSRPTTTYARTYPTTHHSRSYPTTPTYSQPRYRHVTQQPTTYSRTYTPTTTYSGSTYSQPRHSTVSRYSQPTYSRGSSYHSGYQTVPSVSSTRHYSGSSYTASPVTGVSGLVRVTDPQTGAVFHVSQSDYDRNYR